MLELVVIGLASTAAAVMLVWLWRKVTEFKGTSVVSLSSNRNTRLKLGQQQGYVTLPGADGAERALLKKRTAGESRKPWGW